MQDNQTISGVQLVVTIGHTSILLKMVEHTELAMIVGLLRDATVLTIVLLVLLLKCYNNLNNRKAHQKIQSYQIT